MVEEEQAGAEAEAVRSPHFRSHGASWGARAAALAAGVVLALLALSLYRDRKMVADEVALGQENQTAIAVHQGVRLNAWRVREILATYRPAAEDPTPREVLWLGNSQMHAINQVQPTDRPAPWHATEALGRRVYALSMPNADFQEFFVLTAWAFTRRQPEWLVIPLVFDDLREEGLRHGFQELAPPPVREALGRYPLGAQLVAELARMEAGEQDAQGTTRTHQSLQDRTEEQLQRWLSQASGLWADRGEILVALKARELYQLRNRLLRVDSSSKRPMIPPRYRRNMAALGELLQFARDRGVRTLTYVAPLRWDVEPPYLLDEYRRWQAEVEALAQSQGAQFFNLERLVPDRYWGSRAGQPDFMHFQGEGHRLLGLQLAQLLRAAETPAGGEH